MSVQVLASRWVRRFRDSESGGIIIFSLYIFLVMIAMVGMAVDLMRFETQRSMLQNAIDRASVAAADLDQLMDPEEVVRDYLTKAGQIQYLESIEVDEGLNYRTVTVNAKVGMTSPFFNILATYGMVQPASATATERVDDLEVSMVLDISGSMGGSKIRELRTAATNFVSTLMSRTEFGDITISIIPYATQVSLPPELADAYNFDRFHDFSSCVNFEDADFDTTGIDPDQDVLAQTQHFDPFYYWGTVDNSNERAFVCNENTYAEVLPFAHNLATITNAINALQAGGNTSIDVGVKWGAALLDPSANDVVLELIQQGMVDGAFAARPATFEDEEAIKVLVVMTDGVNTTQYRLNDSLRDGWSNVYEEDNGELWVHDYEHRYDGDDNDYSTYERWFNSRRERNGWGNFWRNTWHFSDSGNLGYDDIPRELTRLTWAEVFDKVSLLYNAWYHNYAREWRSNDFYTYAYWAMNNIGPATKDARLDRICTAAKEQNIVIYTVGFEVTNYSATVMESCASSPSHFFRVAGEELTTAFTTIARNITDLRLTN
ncbi:TadE/TadG family type IV pilus assembly protein [Roseisalinus antarcticus]|uniref:von Willebrand factor type A domain protein n=1 Tax=Roseisalinus antarcticus TaxID=254357 RepID=A0A1Y5S223_9RHOB|nr:TadE/TadG family type IV pilus assembly protein [Roseisalinus antarcticus]SLN27902.1 von Willebrand factor type A domain protein [Roseisalinus antarcticus]